ncbi:RNA polymerase sigma factor [Croceitalea vernalis]|uniref:Sigma-70 family RNA polymerase sigma factor n=1 Tax=Croceitalea vernalis TaxID=3075599 RepID=A0ABU3BHC0_9FLAO|nr:sigma-70 family RNA polymerase sigma factor [Croceitalea sp. P007]MDT0621520.1 sigma-70 family RNA polymerase sigma factor [Croceitalea sp. P007]
MKQKEKVFIELIKEYEGLIFKASTIYTNNKQDQKDLFQEIVYQLWKSFDSFKNQAKISTWMYRVAMNTAITQLKRSKKSPTSESFEKVVFEQMETYDAAFEENLKKVYEQINQLNTLEKGLMLLLLEGKSYQEISEVSGLSITNVGTRINRVKSKLKSKLVK